MFTSTVEAMEHRRCTVGDDVGHSRSPVRGGCDRGSWCLGTVMVVVPFPIVILLASARFAIAKKSCSLTVAWDVEAGMTQRILKYSLVFVRLSTDPLAMTMLPCQIDFVGGMKQPITYCRSVNSLLMPSSCSYAASSRTKSSIFSLVSLSQT